MRPFPVVIRLDVFKDRLSRFVSHFEPVTMNQFNFQHVQKTLSDGVIPAVAITAHAWDNPFEFEVALNKWIHDYNNDSPHQSLNNLTSRQCFENYNKELTSNLKIP